MKEGRNTFQTLVLGTLLVGLGAAAGWWWGQNAPEEKPAASEPGVEERRVLYWYDPMTPQVHFDQPGKSPYMDMDLVPKYADIHADTGEQDALPGVKINAQVVQNLALREAVVEQIERVSVVEASGLIAFNERDVSLEQVRSGGVVERVWPLAPGDVIDAGQPLAEVLVPEWTAAQAEFLVLRSTADSDLVEAARQRMRLLGMSTALIDELARTGRARQSFILKSSRAGVLESLDVRSGMTLMAGQMLARIQGIASVWLEVAVPEQRAAAVQPGAHAQVRLAAWPGRAFSGQVTAVLPTLAAASRTLRVRIELPNPHGELRAGMSAQVRLESSEGELALSVPTEAIIRTGKRSLVIAVQDDGRYTPVEVALGSEIDDRTVITEGLSEGQKIVASAQFLLDSEASLSGILARAPAATRAPASHQLEAMEKDGVQP